jgi:hypothetical protein
MTDQKPSQRTFPFEQWMLVDSNPCPKKSTIRGETSRSWLCGEAWDPSRWKIAKKEAVFISEEQATEILWTQRAKYPIAERIRSSYGDPVPPAVLRQIAGLLGYAERPCPKAGPNHSSLCDTCQGGGYVVSFEKPEGKP